MPTLPAPLPIIPGAGDLPVKTAEDVREGYPAHVKQVPAANAPVREAIVEGQRVMQLRYQERAGYAAVQSDPTRATGIYLAGHAEDRGFFKQQNEDDEALRARVFAVPDIVTPAAIVAVVNAILAPYSNVECQYLESALDRLFVQDGNGDTGWHSFIGAPPEYPDRYYALRPNSSPGGAWVFSNEIGRMFVLRVPVLESLDESHAFAWDGTVNLAAVGAPRSLWIHDGSDTGGSESNGSVATFITVGLATPLEVYQAIANTVTAIKGAGVRWMLVADPGLG